MKKNSILNYGRKLLLSTLFLVGVLRVSAQVTGTKTVGTDYPTLAAAITALNTIGISGAVTINVPGGYTETAPAGGYLLGSTILNGSTSATNTLTFQKSGAGANPVLTAPTGTSTSVDGIFTIQGTDYVTINSIDLAEAAANTTATTWMEWGYGLVKLQNAAPFDGSQNVTIQNCTITLNNGNTTSVGIYSGNHIATATTALTITAATDAMSNCKFYGNTIQNCNTGISLRGFAASSPYALYDQNNDIGGASPATANTIRNFAGGAAGSGVNLRYQNSTNVAYNNINNIAGSGTAATSTLYGVYAQNGTNSSVNILNNIINLTQGTTSSSLFGVNISFSGTGTINANSNTFTANGGSSGAMYMIYLSSGNSNVTTNNNNFSNINVATTGSLYLIDHSSASSTTNITCNNNFTSGAAIPYVSKTGAGGTVAGYWSNASSSGGFASVNNNNFSYISMAGNPTFYGIDETNGGSGQNKFIRNNTISNITAAGGTLYGVRVGYAATENVSRNNVSTILGGSAAVYGIYVVSGTTDTVANNAVHDLTSTGNVYGIYVDGGTTINIYQDTVYTLSSTSSGSGVCYGIWQGSGTTLNIYQNKIYDILAAGTGSSANGIYSNSGTVTAYNNLIGDVRTPNLNSATSTQLVGMYLGAGTAYNIYYNTIFMNASSTGADFGSCAVFTSTSPAVILRNNIFVNNSTANGAGLTIAYRRSSATLTTYQAASDRNLFYAGTPGASNLIFYDGTTPYATLAAYKGLVSPRDGSSVTENPTFVSTVGSAANFLHISTSVPTQIESGGANIAGITTDIDGIVRAGNTGYTGSGTAPDLGASEGNYLPTDLTAPNIVYTALPNACTTGDRTFTATITDASGVPTTGSLMPRVYFTKGGVGPWFSTPGVLSSGTATNGTWTFTISAAAMGGLALGDNISYFVIAQDVAPVSNIGANPSAGVTASDVNTVTGFPTAPNVYTIISTLTGTFTVGSGAGMSYPTLTAAVSAYNNSCISGAVVFELTDALYSTAETFPITIGSNPAAGAGNSLTIRPATGISPVITGSSSSAIIVLDGADYITIDGANTPVTNTICPRVAATRDITIENTNTGTSSAVVWIQTTTGADAATNNTIRNTNIKGSGNTRTLFGIGSGGTSISYTSPGTGNNNNRIENDSVFATQTGIFSRGASATNKNTGTVINQNALNAPSPDNLRNNGIFTGFEDGIIISGNNLANISNGASNDIIAINLGFNNNSSTNGNTTGNDVTNATVTYNKIDNITQTNTWTALGIAVAGVTSGTNTIANNMISGVLAKGTGSDFSSGIFIGGAAGGITNVFYNTVNITGSFTGGSQPAYAFSASGTDPIINLKNNIFVNSGDPGGTGLIQAIGLASATYANLSSDRNDFFTTGTSLARTGGLGSGATTQATLGNWQTATGNDANSKNINPTFVSASDLHVTSVGANVPLMNTGVPVAVTTDYDCAARNAATPDIGLNEFNVPICTSVTAGTISAGSASFCGVGTTTVTVTGATSALGITYQWLSSTDSVSWSAIGGATNTSYVIAPAIATTTYYRFIVTCSYSGVSDSVAMAVVVHPLPVISVTPNGGGYCSGTASSVTMTASGALTYSWAPATGLSATAGATVIASPAATTAYVVTGTDAFGCLGTQTATVTVTPTPPAVIITPAADSICSGASVALSASASLPATIFADSFNTTLGAWTVDNTGSTNTAAIPNTEWQTRADGYVYSGTTFHSPDLTQFAMTNSDAGGSGSTTHSMLISPSFSLTGYTAATLTFDHYYRYRAGDIVQLEISTNGGSTWTLLNDYSTPATTVGGAAAFASASFDLSPYLGNPNCQIRFNYQSPWGWYWAIDNFMVTGAGSYTNITWSPSTGLYNDAALSSPYTGAVATTVYAAQTATTVATVNTYTATATNGTCSNTGTSVITVNPLPDAGAVTGPNNVCPGATIALTDAVAGGVWSSSNTNATVTSSGIVTGVTGGTATISYSVTNICGTAAATTAITINPAADSGIISGPTAVCGGATISLSETVPGGVWVSSNNAIATVSASGTVTGVTTGSVVISYTTTNSCGSATATYTITVDQAPNAGTISGPTTVCEGDSIILGSSAPGGVWSSNSANATVSPTGTVTGVSAGTVIITYSATTACGTANAVYPVVINPTPLAYTVTGGGAYCAGSGGVHVGLSGSDNGVVYHLFNGSTPMGSPVGSGGPLDFGSITTTGTYTVNATSTLGCFNNMTGSATVAVNPTTPPTVSINTGTGTTVCTGTPVTFQAITTNEGSDPTYQWTVNGVNVSGSNTYSYLPSNGDVVSVLVTSSTCASPDTASSTVTMTVGSYASPAVEIVADPDTIVCQGSPVTLLAIYVFGGTSPVIRWMLNGAYAGTGTTFTYIPAEGDNVSATLYSNFPCRSADSVFSNTLALHTTPVVAPTVTISANPGTSIPAGQYDTLVANVTNGGLSPSYQWYVNTTLIPGATNQSYASNSFSNGDSVSVMVTSSGTCGGIQTFNWIFIHVGSVGVSQVGQAKADIRLMPNPNKGMFSVKGALATTQDAAVHIEVIDMLGQVIYRKEVTARSGQIDEQITLSTTIANGMYTLSISSGTERSIFHFVVQQ